MQLGNYGWEIDPTRLLILRIRNNTFVCPAVDRASMRFPHFLTVVVDDFGVVDMDDHVMVHFACPETENHDPNPDVPVYVKTPVGTFATVSAKLTEFQPQPFVITDDKRMLLRLSSATNAQWRRVLGLGLGLGPAWGPVAAPSTPLLARRASPRMCFYPNESARERKFHVVCHLQRVARDAAHGQRQRGTRTTRMLLRAPKPSFEEETTCVLDEIDDDAVADMVAWHDFYLGGDATHVLVHLLRHATLKPSEELASALEMAADEVRTALVRARAQTPTPAPTPTPPHPPETFRR